MRVRVRYDQPDENGNTRRERNARVGEITPLLSIPDAGRYLWDWYFDLSNSLRRVRDGICEPLPPSEFIGWKRATGTIVYSDEYAILRAMDVAFCSETNKELADYRERQREKQKEEVEAEKAKRGRRR